MLSPMRFGGVCAAVLITALVSPFRVAAQEGTARYFDQLRARGLFSIAESYAVSRLAQTRLAPARRIELAIELSRTLSRHAQFASPAQQKELWDRARSTLDDERTRHADSPAAALLNAQQSLVLAEEAHWLTEESELHPFDEPFAEQARRACTAAIERLAEAERVLQAPSRPKSPEGEAPSSHDFRVALHHVRFALAGAYRNRAALTDRELPRRRTDLDDAELTARRLITTSDDPLPFRAKLMLVSAQRLKGEWKRAEEMLSALDADGPRDESLQHELVAERVRLNLDRKQPADALQLLVATRSRTPRLSGELWYLQVRSLVALREVALSRKDTALAESFREQAEVTLTRCAEQAGGFWSRRTQSAWELTRTAEKYGPELDSLMQQARADFLAGNAESSAKKYERAELAARARQQTDLAAELGYTRASVLLHDKRYDDAESAFAAWMTMYPDNPRLIAAHLNWGYCLGRLYDRQKTQSRRERYTAALDGHLMRFPNDPTANDARFFKAQLEEQRLQATVALPLYLNVAPDHARADEARAGAARCYETILIRLRERKLPSGDFEQTARATLDGFLKAFPVEWTVAQAEVAVHAAAILLMTPPPQFDRAAALVDRVLAAGGNAASDAANAPRWSQLRQRAQSLRVVTLAGHGNPLEAEKLIQSLGNASIRDLFAIVERLAPFVATEDRQRQAQYVSLQLRALEMLEPHRATLTDEEQSRLDRIRATTFLASGQIARAVEIFTREVKATANDSGRQKEIALLLAELDNRECQVLARSCWRRIESLHPAGSPEWLEARAGVIAACAALGDTAEARKFLTLTRVLTPNLDESDSARRFEMLERRLKEGAADRRPK